MIISTCDRKKIKQEGKFLIEKGFEISEDSDTIIFKDKRNEIIVDYEKYERISSISIRFKERNEVFSIGWIAFVRNNLQSNPREPLQNVLKLLDYIRKEFNVIIDYDYCKQSQILIERYILEQHK